MDLTIRENQLFLENLLSIIKSRSRTLTNVSLHMQQQWTYDEGIALLTQLSERIFFIISLGLFV